MSVVLTINILLTFKRNYICYELFPEGENLYAIKYYEDMFSNNLGYEDGVDLILNIDEERAVKIAKYMVYDEAAKVLKFKKIPYYVYYDEGRNLYFVFASLERWGSSYLVVIDKMNGAITQAYIVTE